MVSWARYSPQRILLLVLAIAGLHGFSARPALAQVGQVHGLVTDSASGTPLEGVMLAVTPANGGQIFGLTDGRGRFRIDVPADGMFAVQVTRIGYAPRRIDGVRASSAPLVVRLLPLAFQVAPVVVMASMVRESQLIAPAATYVVSRETIQRTLATTAVDVLRDVPGIDFAHKGLFSSTFSARGPRNVTAQDMLVLHDYRYAALPVLGFNTGGLIPAAQGDLERVEVVRGPAAVMYGPNSRRGVVHLVSRSPLVASDRMLLFGAGQRSLFDGSGGFSQRWGSRVAVRMAGRYARGKEWAYTDPVETAARQQAVAAGARADTLRIGARIPDNSVLQGEGRVDWMLRDNVTLTTSAGFSEATGIETSGEAGAAQSDGWRYSFLQTRLETPRLFANVMYNLSDAGSTYNLRTGGLFVDNSRLLASQVQYRAEAGPLRLLAGGDFRRGVPQTGGTLNGRFEDDDALQETGAYVHASAALSPRFELSGALRLDHHNRLADPWFLSPRVSLVARPSTNHSLRLAASRSFAQPSTRDLFPDLFLGPLGPLPFGLRLAGSGGQGFTFSRECGGLCMRVPAAFGGGQVRTLPAQATLMWPVVVAFLRQQGLDLSALPAPTATQVKSLLALLNPATGGFTPVNDLSVRDVAPARRAVESVFEGGYKGHLSSRLFATIDVHFTRASDVYATTSTVNTPNVFFDPVTLTGWLSQFMPTTAAQQTAGAIASIPLGTIMPNEVPGADLLIFQPATQGGSYNYWGLDLALTYQASDRLSLSSGYSWVSKDSTGLGGVDGFLLFHTPQHKGMAAAEWQDTRRGVQGTLRGRAISGFSVRTPAYVGTVDPYAVFDAGIGVRLPFGKDTWLSLDALNVLNTVHTEFVGSPDIGRRLASRVRMRL
ncbi:MAG: TonB-dependent receptor [Gemmatimonadetes bacterium]|nr:TonB-dependent receptor [Gemmatimonadota bacterium]